MAWPKAVLLAVVLLAAVLLGAGPAQASIKKFTNTDPAWQHVHHHTETLYSWDGQHSRRPAISFSVSCPEAADAFISWTVVGTNLNGIARVLHGDDSDPATQFYSARCGVPVDCEGNVTAVTTSTTPAPAGRRRRDPGTPAPTDTDSSTTSPTTSPTKAATQPAKAAVTTTAAPKASTSTSSTTTTTTTTTPAPTADSHLCKAGDGPPVTTNSMDEPVCCSHTSGLLYVPSRTHKIVVGGCMHCRQGSPSHAVHRQIVEDGYYTLWIESFSPGSGDDSDAPGPRIVGESTFINVHGYLSAELYPLLIFYGVLGLAYLILGLIWLALMICYRTDILRLQFWISSVILIGMLESAFSFGDLDEWNKTGTRSQASKAADAIFLLVLSKILYASKNTLARLLVLVVSLGYSIVKPRLGGALKQVIAVGVSYFFFSCAYGVTHATGQAQSEREEKSELMIILPLSILDSAICWWIFLSLSHTMKILRLRNNTAKLRMYEKFKWALIVCITATVIFAMWTLYDRFGTSATAEPDWRSSWSQDAYWQCLFFGVLIVIAALWRPSDANRQFAYTPLETDLEDDADYTAPNFSSDTMKMRTLTARGHAPAPKEESSAIEDDLAWVEANVALSSGDGTLGSFPLDSDEEIAHTRFEISKMD